MTETIQDWMSDDPVSTTADASALEALSLMQEHGIRHLPVIDPARRVVGVLSIDDLRAALPFDVTLRAAPHRGEVESAREWCVGDVMTHAPVTLHEGDALAEAAERMAARRIGCLPIVDEKGRLAGILSETDLLNALASLLWADRARERHRAPQPELERLIADLGREREALVRRRDRYREAERELSTHAGREPIDVADEGSDRAELLVTEALDEHALRRLRALDAALERAEKGLLEVCDACGGRIPLARLRALPGTSVCVECARRAERR